MNSNDTLKEQFAMLEKQIDKKIEKLELLVSQLQSLFQRVDQLEETVGQFNSTTFVRKQSVVYLDKEGKVKTLNDEKQ